MKILLILTYKLFLLEKFLGVKWRKHWLKTLTNLGNQKYT